MDFLMLNRHLQDIMSVVYNFFRFIMVFMIIRRQHYGIN